MISHLLGTYNVPMFSWIRYIRSYRGNREVAKPVGRPRPAVPMLVLASGRMWRIEAIVTFLGRSFPGLRRNNSTAFPNMPWSGQGAISSHIQSIMTSLRSLTSTRMVPGYTGQNRRVSTGGTSFLYENDLVIEVSIRRGTIWNQGL